MKKTWNYLRKPANFSAVKRIVQIMALLLLFSCVSKKKTSNELQVFAAASLSDLVSELAKKYEEETGVTIKLNYAGSGTLARQIDQGARADIYLSANKSWTNYLIEKGKCMETVVFAKNELVLIVPNLSIVEITKVDSLLLYSSGKIAIGDPGFVPAGKYASEVFEHYKLDLTEKLFHCQDVRSALMMVELGEADFGIVYKTDAMQSEKVKMVFTFPVETHAPVEYHMALISEKNLAKEFYDYLYSPECENLISDYSFIAN